MTQPAQPVRLDENVDVLLIGGGTMSTTLGAMLTLAMPNKRILLLEKLPQIAGESTAAWNNAGTGHSGYCELNYMPDPADGSKAVEIAEQFRTSLDFWSSLVAAGELPSEFLTPVPHMSVVFGDDDVEYLRRRWNTLRCSSYFAAMEYSEDPDVIRRWAPLLMEGRPRTQPVGATFFEAGTDVDFGALSTALSDVMARHGAEIRTSCEVSNLNRERHGGWMVTGRDHRSKRVFRIRSEFVFVGAGGSALNLLQKSRIPQVRGYGVFPFGAEFFRTDEPGVVENHNAKVYGKPELGAPPMSLPHLDLRVVNGKASVMFGPYATFSTKLSKAGRFSDLFKTVRGSNIPVLLAVGIQNFGLVRYLVAQLLSPRRVKFAQLRKYYPEANPAQWYSVQAGQRAQLIRPHPRKIGELVFGTELVVDSEGTIAGLLGASPGASVAPSIMKDLIAQCFPECDAGVAQ